MCNSDWNNWRKTWKRRSEKDVARSEERLHISPCCLVLQCCWTWQCVCEYLRFVAGLWKRIIVTEIIWERRETGGAAVMTHRRRRRSVHRRCVPSLVHVEEMNGKLHQPNILPCTESPQLSLTLLTEAGNTSTMDRSPTSAMWFSSEVSSSGGHE